MHSSVVAWDQRFRLRLLHGPLPRFLQAPVVQLKGTILPVSHGQATFFLFKSQRRCVVQYVTWRSSFPNLFVKGCVLEPAWCTCMAQLSDVATFWHSLIRLMQKHQTNCQGNQAANIWKRREFYDQHKPSTIVYYCMGKINCYAVLSKHQSGNSLPFRPHREDIHRAWQSLTFTNARFSHLASTYLKSTS